jgi:antitoxin component YwqK of YwqJK toxin-antitoxin module
MRCLTFMITILWAFQAVGQTFADLVEKDGLYYDRNSDSLFSGRISGVEEGMIIDGKKEGEWSTFFSNGRLLSKSYFKAGLLNGPFKSYQSNGDVRSVGSYKNGKRSGQWVTYQSNGDVWHLLSGTFVEGIKVK